jgi:hypothetical protein
MNYGETLAFWYLRLNGFFPLMDFVFHRGEDLRHTSDCDLLAVRFPHVFEEVGGQKEDWDWARFRKWGINLAHPVVVIAQVKTGAHSDAGAFDAAKVQRALCRVGLWEIEEVTAIVEVLRNSALFADAKAQVVKVLVASEPRAQEDRYRILSLCEVLGFLRQRFERYQGPKEADRLFFKDELIQFMASNEGKS